jgi:hypothetical protein
MPNPTPILDYATPKPDDGKPDIFTDGRTDLYIRKPGGELPRRCIVCNDRVRGQQTTLKLNYVDPEIRRAYRGAIMLFWVWIPVRIIRGIHERAARQSIKISYSVCPHHRSNRGAILFMRLSFLLMCIIALPIAESRELGNDIIFISCAAIVLNLLFPWPKRQLRIDRMTATHAVLIGPSEEFLQSLRKPRQL